MLDLRIPSGWFFLGIGIILISLGVTRLEQPAPLTTANVNLYAGLSMAVFGGAMLWLAKRTS